MLGLISLLANMCVFVMAPLCWRGFQRCLDREGCWADGTESSLTSQQTQDPPRPPSSPPTLLWSHFPAQTLTSFTLSSAGLSLTLSLSPPPTAAHNSTVHCSRASPPSAWPPDPTVDQQLHSHIKPGREGGRGGGRGLSYFRISHVQRQLRKMCVNRCVTVIVSLRGGYKN